MTLVKGWRAHAIWWDHSGSLVYVPFVLATRRLFGEVLTRARLTRLALVVGITQIRAQSQWLLSPLEKIQPVPHRSIKRRKGKKGS